MLVSIDFFLLWPPDPQEFPSALIPAHLPRLYFLFEFYQQKILPLQPLAWDLPQNFFRDF